MSPVFLSTLGLLVQLSVCHLVHEDCCDLTKVPTNIPANSTTIKLNFNRIRNLEACSFLKNKFCTELHLLQNVISDIKLKAFDGLMFLKYLDLSENNIELLKPNTFSALKNCNILLLKDNIISNLQVGVFNGLSKLKHLDLSHNHIVRFTPNVFMPLMNCEILHIEGNLLSALEFGDLHGLKSLDTFALPIYDCVYRTDKKYDESRKKQQNNNSFLFYYLNLWKGIPVLKSAIFSDLSSCTKLFLNRYRIRIIEEKAFVGLHTLKHLALERNQITAINLEWLTPLLSLEEINLQFIFKIKLHGNQSSLALSTLQRLSFCVDINGLGELCQLSNQSAAWPSHPVESKSCS